MYDNQEVNKKKYYLSENHDSHICLESGKCEYVDDKVHASICTIFEIVLFFLLRFLVNCPHICF